MINASDINAAIAAREAEIERLRRDLEIAEAKLRGMKELRDQILGTQPAVGQVFHLQAHSGKFNIAGAEIKATHSGRQPGAISKRWRKILSDLYRQDLFDESVIIDTAEKHGLNLKHSSARLQMAVYTNHGYVEAKAGGWRVTPTAATKFNFLRNENEAPSLVEREDAS
jgi:predicted DsbA family dithiol-disulfide isomerase